MGLLFPKFYLLIFIMHCNNFSTLTAEERYRKMMPILILLDAFVNVLYISNYLSEKLLTVPFIKGAYLGVILN